MNIGSSDGTLRDDVMAMAANRQQNQQQEAGALRDAIAAHLACEPSAGYAGCVVRGALAVRMQAVLGGSDDTTDEALRDLLTNLMHYAASRQFDFVWCLVQSRSIYEEEAAED